MFFGGWLYPEVNSFGAAGAEVTLGKDALDCAAMGTDVKQATTAPTNKQVKAFWPGISSPLQYTQAAAVGCAS
jgi:hypothetical protein